MKVTVRLLKEELFEIIKQHLEEEQGLETLQEAPDELPASIDIVVKVPPK